MVAPPITTTPKMNRILGSWRLEIFNCVLAIAMLGSMYGTLHHYDGQRVPDWDIPINLSTLVAFITIIFRTSLVFVLAEVIGQAKWKYFVGNRPEDPPMRRLIETSRFNDASQGIFGAVKLIPTIIKYPDVLLAVMVMIASLATGSFVQQAIQTRPCQFSTDSVNASLPISRNITYKTSGGKRSGSNLAAIASSSLFPDNEEIGSPISVGCSTGNCTFQNSIGGLYNTLGVCSCCTDTSSLIASTKWTEINFELDATDFFGKYTLPNGLSIPAMFTNDTLGWRSAGLSVSSTRLPNPGSLEPTNFMDLTGDMDWAGDRVSPEMRALSQWAFTNVTVFTSNWLPTSLGYTDYLAVTCTLYPCLRTYNASVTMGKLDEVLINTVPLAPNVNIADSNDTAEATLKAPSWFSREGINMLNLGFSLQAVQSPCLVNNTPWTKDNTSSTVNKQNLLLLQADPGPNRTRHFKVEKITAPTECIYSIDFRSWQGIMISMIGNTFNGTCFAWSYSHIAVDGEIDCGKSYWLSRFYKDTGMTTSDIFERFESFADRLSNKLRMGLLGDPEYIFGQTLQTTICVDLDYRWLTFPTVLVFITSALLVWAIFCNCRHQSIVWKTSILPFLFYSEQFVIQNGEDMSAESTQKSQRAAMEELMNLDQMQIEAKQQMVRFSVFN